MFSQGTGDVVQLCIVLLQFTGFVGAQTTSPVPIEKHEDTLEVLQADSMVVSPFHMGQL